MGEQPRVVIVTGMSGAGKSAAADSLEDMGYFVIDNLPADLIERVVELSDLTDRPRERLAVVIDARAGTDFEEQLHRALLWLQGHGVPSTVLFLDADDQTLHQRYEEHRRPHPIRRGTLGESIAEERRMLGSLRGEADVVVDTSDLNVHELESLLEEVFAAETPRRPMQVSITSFGFKHGVPRDIDLLFDVRFLPNPHWEEELRPLSGRDEAVRRYVLSQPDAKEFMARVRELLEFLLPRFEAEGKAYVSIGVGCTGGRHRSVTIAEELRGALAEQGVSATVRHRDADR